MADEEVSILCHSVGRAGLIYRENSVRISDGITCRIVLFAIGNQDIVMVPAQFGLFRSMFGIRDVEVAGQSITPCH